MPILEAVGIAKTYGDGTVALAGVDLRVEPGETVALVGESGSGKTTLLRIFNRMVEPSAGAVRVEGQPVATIDPIALRRRIGYVPQDGGLLPHWRVGRNVGLVLRLRGEGEGADERANDSLRLVGLDPEVFRNRWPRELSGGQRQRVAIARALAPRPRVLLLDEPFGALDAISRADLQESFAALRASSAAHTLTCVLVTHDLHEAFLLADRIVVLRRGRIEQADAPETLLSRPATPYVRELLNRARVSDADLAPQFVRQTR